MKKSIVLIIFVSLFMTSCGTEVGNHKPVANANVPEYSQYKANVPDELPLYLLVAWCGSLFSQNYQTPIVLNKDGKDKIGLSFKNESWDLSYNDKKVLHIVPVQVDDYTVEATDLSNPPYNVGKDLVCKSDKDLTGTGTDDQKLRYLTIDNGNTTYKISWIADQTVVPAVLESITILNLSSDAELTWLKE